LSLALDAQTDIVTTQRMISDIEIKKQQEQFGVLASVDGNDILSVSIQNQGQHPVEISSMWIINKTLSDQPVKRYAVNYDDAYVSSGFTDNVLSSQTLQMIPDTYDIKIISAFGSIKIVEIDTDFGSSNGLRAELITDPPDVIMGQNVTVAMIVTNTGEMAINNVRPGELITGGIGSVDEISLNAPSMVDLIPGESEMFSWDTRVDGNSGDTLIFTANATGDFVDIDEDAFTADVSDTSIIRDPADGGETIIEKIVLTQDLLSRPEMFLIIPGPFGDGPEKGMWGVNVVNPTGQDMFVSKVVITLLSPRANSLDRIFSASSGSQYCDPEPVAPTPNNWSCPENNELVWKDLDNPVRIPPFSVFPFLAKVHADRLSGSTDTVEALIVNANVFTTFGEFSKSGYSSSMDNGGNSYVNVYLSDVPHSTTSADIKVNQTVASGANQRFNVVVADFEIGGAQIIDSSKLIINIPKGWTVNNSTITGFDNFVWNYKNFTDTSSQIIANFTSNLTDGGRTIQFDATAPTVIHDQMYVMHILADGKTTNQDFSLSALTEAVLKVTP